MIVETSSFSFQPFLVTMHLNIQANNFIGNFGVIINILKCSLESEFYLCHYFIARQESDRRTCSNNRCNYFSIL